MKHTLELRTTISPTPYFFRRIHYMAASLREIGGPLADHELVVSVGGEGRRENLYRAQPWSSLYPILWRWVDPETYGRLGYRATNRDRAWHMARSRFVMIVDADVLFMADFAELLDEIARTPALCGVIGYKSPFLTAPAMQPAYAGRLAPDAPDAAHWGLLAESLGIETPPLEHPYAAWGVTFEDESRRLAPAYFNGAMILGPAEMIEAMCALYPEAEDAVDRVMDSYFRPQIARALAIAKAGLPIRALPQRYNFPNVAAFDAAYPDELAEVRILHYLHHKIMHRDDDFADAEATARLIARTDLQGSNERLRRRVAELHETVVAEERVEAFA